MRGRDGVKFTVVPKDVLMRGYFLLKALFVRMEDRYHTHDHERAFDRAYLSFIITCVQIARRIGRRIRYPWRLRKVARRVFRDTIAP